MEPIKGMFAAAITPRRADSNDIDQAALWDLFDFLDRKVDGIVLLGSTGEFVHYGTEERAHIASLAVKRSRAPVIVNISSSTLEGSIELAEAALDAGAAAMLLMPPYFFRYTAGQLREFFDRFASEVSHEIPRLLYNIPIFSSPLPADETLRLLDSGRYDGVKDSSGDWDYFSAIAPALAGRTLLMGNDAGYVRAYSSGASGAVSGCASAVPELMVALERALRSGDGARIQKLHEHVSEFVRQIGRMPVPVGIREAAACRGIHVGPHASGTVPGADEFRDWFRGWWPPVEKECAPV